MSETPSAGNCDPFARPCCGLLDSFVGGYPGTDERRSLGSLKAGRDMGHVIRVREDVLDEAAVPGITAELRLGAHRLPSRQAILAMTTRRVEPRNADPVALLHDRNARSNGRYQTDALMSRNEREFGFQRPVSMRGMEIGVAYAAGLRLNQDLPRPGSRNVPFPNHQGLSEFFNNCGLHRVSWTTPLLRLETQPPEHISSRPNLLELICVGGLVLPGRSSV